MPGSANVRFLEALEFAASAHSAVCHARKGTDFPYISHPIRVAEILDRFERGDDVVVAGFLHDVIEDAGVTSADLEAAFGSRVAALVQAASEPDKSLPWRERKERTLANLRSEQDADVIALVAADKLDNVRALAETLQHDGPDATWALFNAGRRDQHWYYRNMAETLLERAPNDLLLRTLDYETQNLFPEPRRETGFFPGRPLGTPHDTRAYLADPIKHWKPDHSALQLAEAWIGAGGIPDDVRAVLETSDIYAGCEFVEGFFEREVALGTPGRASQTDLMVLVRLAEGYGVVAVEGKAREPFGPKVRTWNDGPGKQARLDDLCGRLGIDPSRIGHLRYQLFHRAASALIEAERYGAIEALMLVHSFDREAASFDEFQAFAAELGVRGSAIDAITEAVPRGNVALRLGWVRAG
jgi:hypothetical protein